MPQQKLYLLGRTVAAFDPYGSNGCSEPPGNAVVSQRLDLGAAEILDHETLRGHEAFALERAAEYWLLRSTRDADPSRLIACVRENRLPVDPRDAGAELLIDLWKLRQPRRLRLIRGLRFGDLGRERWQMLEAQIKRGNDDNGASERESRNTQTLERKLLAEGQRVQSVVGPIGTTEHVLLLGMSSSQAATPPAPFPAD